MPPISFPCKLKRSRNGGGNFPAINLAQLYWQHH